MCNSKKKKNWKLTVATNEFFQAGFIDSLDIWQLTFLASDIHVVSKCLRLCYGFWHCFGQNPESIAYASKKFTYSLVGEEERLTMVYVIN